METISLYCSKSIGRFRNLTALEGPQRPGQYDKAVAASIRDSQGRFKVWCGNLGASKTDRSSLDYRLREAPRTKALVLKLLQDLRKLLEKEFTLVVEDPTDSEDTETIRIDDEGSLSDLGSYSASQVQLIAEDISRTIDLLYRAAVQFSQRSTKDNFSKAADIDVSAFEQYDHEYISEKYPRAEGWLVKRIGRALLKRRQYVRYRELHAAKLAQPPLDAIAETNADEAGSDETRTILSGTTATTFKEEQPEYSPAAYSKDDAASILSATTYSSMVAESLRMPKPPDGTLDGGPFLCPICHRMHQFSAGQARQAWWRHVFRDLQPYVCTVESCNIEDTTYESRHKWFSHEVKNHRQSWRCQGHCAHDFRSREEFEKHVRENVPSISKEQVPTFVDMCATPLSVTTAFECPLCKEDIKGVKQFEKHLGRHLEEIALFALPQSLLGDGDDSEESGEEGEKENDFVRDASIAQGLGNRVPPSK